MIAYIVDEQAQTANARFGHLDIGTNTRQAMPAASPCPRTDYEARALIDLAQAGHVVSSVVIPITRRRKTVGALAPLLGGRRTASLDEFVRPVERPFVVPDLETEALAKGCAARSMLQREKGLPDVMVPLLSCALRGDSAAEQVEAGAAWDQAEVEFGFARLRQWFEAAEAQTGSPVFYAPTPIIRATVASVDRAFRMGWTMADAVETATFVGRGIHLLIHSEVFFDNPHAEAARERILEHLRALTHPTHGRIAPFVSIKILDTNEYLMNGRSARIARQNLSHLFLDAKENVRAAGGLLIAHNWGTWLLGALDSGADIVTFRCNGEPFEIDPQWGPKTPGAAPRSVRMAAAPRKDLARSAVAPWDSSALADGRLSDFKSAWERNGAFPTADHVEPRAWWNMPMAEQREYRARQIISSLLSVAKEFRETACAHAFPLREGVVHRIQRMKDQDALYDLCPSV